MKKVNAETQSFTFKVYTSPSILFKWDHERECVSWEGSVRGECKEYSYPAKAVNGYLACGAWVVISVLNKGTKTMEISNLLTIGTIAYQQEHLVNLTGEVEYTIDWDYSTDFGQECYVDIVKASVYVNENLVEVPLELIENDLEHLKEHIRVEESYKEALS